jgi:hypothetical protein
MPLWSALTVMLWSGLSFASSQAEDCPQGVGGIQIEFEFRNPAMRKDWIYKSMIPVLELPLPPGAEPSETSDEADSQPATGIDRLGGSPQVDRVPGQQGAFHNGRKTFYFYPRQAPPEGTQMRFVYQGHELRLQARPFQCGVRPIIYLVDQPDPDWATVSRAEWLLNIQGEPRLDVWVTNFGDKTHGGLAVTLSLAEPKPTQGQMGCHAPPAPVPVWLSLARGTVTAAAASLENSEMLRRPAALYRGCGIAQALAVDLGNTGPLAAKSTQVIRYELSEHPSIVQPASPPHDALSRSDTDHGLLWPTLSQVFAGWEHRNIILSDSDSTARLRIPITSRKLPGEAP